MIKMSFVNALVKAAKREGISPAELYSRNNAGVRKITLSQKEKNIKKAKNQSPFDGMSTRELYKLRPME
tara:strand:+ start:155 stop:361 length:207 start_codon:yes stop_codon:yes gene_type:complete